MSEFETAGAGAGAPAPMPSGAIGPVADAPGKFYVVSLRKFWILLVATIGFYALAWFYQHWVHVRRFNKDDEIWPVPRALFNIFFTHSLAREIESTLKREGTDHDWEPELIATVYVISAIAMNVCDRLAAREIAFPVTDIIALGALLLMGFMMQGMQQAAHAACHAENGKTNDRLTWVNWIWIVIGILLWGLLAFGVYATATGPV